MSLKLHVDRAGDVAVLRCEGPIISGPEAECLEEKVGLILWETKYLVLVVSGVPRVDSGGLGLLVRLLMRTRQAGGDLKLASPPPFITRLLEMTRLSTLFGIFPSEREAVVSFRKPTPEVPRPSPAARIVFLDQSPDVCAFVRTMLTSHGYEVRSVTCVSDAKIFLKTGNTDVLILGPNTPHSKFEGHSLIESLAALAPKAKVIELDEQFQFSAAEEAGAALLQLLREKFQASAYRSAGAL
jgi:anti-sigma B factor antagonist